MRSRPRSSPRPRSVVATALAVSAFTLLSACAHDAVTPAAPDAALATTDAAAAQDDPTIGAVPAEDTVARVEVGQYVGLWYEIASIPMGFQRNCAATTATYAVVDATTVSVLNRCRNGGLDGDPVEIMGTARVVDAVSNARLEVDFGFARAPYWIVDLAVAAGDEAYPWAIVSNPDRSALWILSRTAQMPAARYDALIARLTARGYQPERLRQTVQPTP